MSFNLNNLSDTRRRLIVEIKRRGHSSIDKLADALELSGEGVRQQLVQLEKEGWINRSTEPGGDSRAGRPTSHFSLTRAGEHLFPKNYQGLSVELIDTVRQQQGEEGLRRLLEAMTESRVREWKPRLEGLDFDEKVETLKDIYRENDDQMQYRKKGEHHELIENNCPFLDVALQRPALCSVTVSTLSRALDARVTRTERFQDGSGRCVFKIEPDRDPDVGSFAFEDETNP